MSEQSMDEVLRRFGWEVGSDSDFYWRYNTDAWVYNLANAVRALVNENERLRAENERLRAPHITVNQDGAMKAIRSHAHGGSIPQEGERYG